MNYVFVYGTLKKGYGNHAAFLNKEPLCTIIAELPFTMVDLGPYPALVPTHGLDRQITGEIYEVDDVILEGLDHLEGYPEYYNRTQFDLRPYGIDGDAWVYFIEHMHYEDEKIVINGDWNHD